MNVYRLMSDEELVKVILDGNADAYTEVIARYKNMLYGVVLHILPSNSEVEDIVQETFIDGYFCLKSLRNHASLAPWLYGIAKRKAYKACTKDKSFEDFDMLENTISDTSAQNSPEDSVLRAETAACVQRALTELSEKNRCVALLYYFKEMSVADIAKRLCLSVGTVKSRLYEARKKLKGELAYMIDQTTNKTTLTDDFDKNLQAKLKQLQQYYALNGASFEGFDTLFNETEKIISLMPESAEKQAALADMYIEAYYKKDDDSYKDKALLAAEKGNNAKVICSVLVDKILATDDYEERLRIIDNEALPRLKELGAENEQGIIMFWRGGANADLKNIEKAKADFEACDKLCNDDEIYRACAICGIRNIELALKHTDDPSLGLQVVAETCVKQDGKLIFANQPGFSTPSVLHQKHNWDSFHYYISCAGRMFYDLSMKNGETYTDNDGTTLTLVSTDAVAETPAALFKNCMHFRCATEDYVADSYYEKDVGLVKAVFTEPNGNKVCYLLDEYKIEGGDGYFPFEKNNYWHYVNPSLPDYLYQCFECKIVWTDGVQATLSTLFYVNFKKNYENNCVLDSEYYLDKAAKLCQAWKLDEAIDALKKAVIENTNQAATFAALNGIKTLSRFSLYHKNGWRFCPSSVTSSFIRTKGNEGAYSYDEAGMYLMSPYRFGTRAEENRIFGVKPLRFLQQLLGRIYDPKWVCGYTEEKDLGDNTTLKFTVDNGGTVKTAAGTFNDTLKLTILCEKAAMEDSYYMKNNYRYTKCGTKEYWLAKGVGIVCHSCTWGKQLSATAELVAYSTPAADDSYMPIQIGNHWEYDEINLTNEGYVAKRIINVDCSINDNYLISDNQEFVFKGTEDEYNEFKKSLN